MTSELKSKGVCRNTLSVCMFWGGGQMRRENSLGVEVQNVQRQVKALWSRTPKDFYVVELKIKSRKNQDRTERKKFFCF